MDKMEVFIEKSDRIITSVCDRQTRMEEQLKSLGHRIESIDTTTKNTDSTMRKMLWTFITLLLTILGSTVVLIIGRIL